MSEQEQGRCMCCGALGVVLSRRYYHYSITCDCCVGLRHFEIVTHCDSCIPKPPPVIKISLEMRPDSE